MIEVTRVIEWPNKEQRTSFWTSECRRSARSLIALIGLLGVRSEEEEVQETEAAAGKAGTEKKGYVGIHATGFKELMLKPELLQAIADCGFEHPSEGESSPAHSMR